MKSRLRFLTVLCFAALMLAANSLWAASAREERAFYAASDAFRDGFWSRAEQEFGDFIKKYPRSEFRAQAVLSQAQARYQLRDSQGAVELLMPNLDRAESLDDQYLFWIAESEYQRTNYTDAASAYARLVALYPDSSRNLESAFGEALARSHLGQTKQMVDLLSATDGVFANGVRSATTNEFVVRGLLLLGETQMAQGDFDAANEALSPLTSQKLNATLGWRVQELRSRILLAQGEIQAAWQASTNLPALAMAGTGPRSQLLAGSIALQAQLLERLNRLDDAISVLQSNLVAGVPADRQREALLKTAELSLALGRPGDARQTLNRFLSENTNTPVADVVYLALGELDLKQFSAGVAMGGVTSTNGGETNRLLRAAGAFDELLQKFPESPLAGRALLGKGWCLWLGGDTSNSLSLFQAATGRIPFLEDRAVAKFKWADAQMATGDFAGALTNYTGLIEDYAEISQVRTQLLEPALYLAARAATRAGNMDAASDAVAKILEWFPASSSGGRSVLLVGQGFIERGDAVQARAMLDGFAERWPDSPLLPQVRLTVARSFEQTGDWASAAARYDEWLGAYSTNQPARPQAEFYRAWANYQAGFETNAFAQFTNFVASFPADGLAPAGQWWVADYFFRQADYVAAEINYKRIVETWPASPLAYEARMMAGRAALARAAYGEAIGHFTNLTSDLKCPAGVWVLAMFAYGDALVQEAGPDTNKFSNFVTAIDVFSTIPRSYPTNAFVSQAWGRIGDCYQLLGAREPRFYEAATNAYHQAMAVPGAMVAARSQAQVGVGLVLEKMAALKPVEEQQAFLKRAQDNYLDVVYQKNLVNEGEKPDLFWVKKAGLEALRLTESFRDWKSVEDLSRTLQGLLPPLRENLERRIARAQEQRTREEN